MGKNIPENRRRNNKILLVNEHERLTISKHIDCK
jgi:hypothetical protein